MSEINSRLASVNHRFFWIQVVLQVVLLCLIVFDGQSSEMLSLSTFLLLVLLGIPHGGNDYYYRPDKSVRGSLRFLGFYLGCMAMYDVLWVYFPSLSLLAFLLISMHHFGQSNFLNDRWHDPASLFWGLWLLGFPVLRHANTAFSIFGDMLGRGNAEVPSWFLLSDKTLLWIVGIFGFIYVVVLKQSGKQHLWQFMLQWLLVTLWFWVAPLILGFIVVFCLWHAAQSMRYQVLVIQSKEAVATWKLILKFLPLGLLAVLGWVFSVEFDVMKHLDLGFILLSMVTLPHVVVMDGIYGSESHRL